MDAGQIERAMTGTRASIDSRLDELTVRASEASRTGTRAAAKGGAVVAAGLLAWWAYRGIKARRDRRVIRRYAVS
jgi:hypothetical protein